MKPISDDDIVIAGISGRFPNSEDLNAFWNNLVNSCEMYSLETERWPTIAEKLPIYSGHLTFHDQFDAELFDVSNDLANYLDPQQRLFYETTYEAIYDAGLDPFSIGGYRSGCFIGWCYNDTQFARFEELTVKPTKFFEKNAQFVCDAFNLKGVSLSVDTACAASFSALHQAVQAFRSNEIDRMIIGALSINQKPSTTLGFSNLRMLSAEGKGKCLDAKVDGYCRSEAIVSLFLQRRKEAKRIYGTIYHSETNCDGYKPEGITFPSIEAQYKLIKKTYEECKLDPEYHITYVEGHITGTPVGDPIESQALVKALRPNRSRPILVGCLKSNMGHSEGASALCGLAKACLIFQHNLIPPNINYETPNPNIPYLENGTIVPVLENTPFDEDFLCLNAFGFGGVNVHVVLKANEKNSEEKDYEIFHSNHLLPENWHLDRSLHTVEALDEFCEREVKNQKLIRLINMTNRTVAGCERAIEFILENREKVNNDYLQLIEDCSFIRPETKLNQHAYLLWSPDGQVLSKKIAKCERSRPLYLVFNGLGSQWPQMGNELLRIKVCARKLVQLSDYTARNFNFNLIEFLAKQQTEDEFNQDLTKCAISIFALQVALIELIKFLEIEVAGFVGYSIGEYASAYMDQCADEYQLLDMIHAFSTICKENLENGVMLSVGLSQDEVQAKLVEMKLEDDLSICCVNSSENTTIGGPEGLIDKFIERYEKEEIFLRKVDTCRQVFHAKSFEKAYLIMLERYGKMEQLAKARSARWLSTTVASATTASATATSTTGENEENAEPVNLSTYLANNLNQTVHFSSAIQRLPADACCLEIGPSCQLLPFVKQESGTVACIPILKRNSENNLNNLFIALGELFNAGCPSKISKLFTPVQYPVSRQTLSLSHLLKLDHSEPRFVYRFPEYYNSLIYTRFFTIRYDNPTYKNFYDHVIDGRILMPATAYLFFAWQSMAEKTMSSYKKTLQIPIEFFDITFKRVILLNKNNETVVKIKINEDNGRFCIIESDQVCCAGKMALINRECESKVDPIKLKPKSVEGEELLVKADVYKEFRVRGYDYQGDFQGIVELYASGRQGKVKWHGSWICFSDSLLQISILCDNHRALFVPTFIEYLRCETDYLVKYLETCTKTGSEPIVDVFFDPELGMGATTGMCVKGVRVVEASRKFERQKPLFQKYCFVPYRSKFEQQEDVLEKLNEYQEAVLKLIKGYRLKVERLEDVEFDLKAFNKNFESKELYTIGHMMLELLKTNYLVEEKKEEEKKEEKSNETTSDEQTPIVLDENNNEAKIQPDENNNETKVQLDENNNVVEPAEGQEEVVEEKAPEPRQMLDLNECIKKQQETLGNDFIFTNQFPLFLANHLAIITENINTKQIRVLEISFTFTLLYDYITMMLNASQVRSEYNLLHPIPVSKAVSAKYGINKVLEVKLDGKISKELNPCHLIVYKHYSSSYLNSLETLDLSFFLRSNDLEERELIKSSFDKLLDGGFFLFFYRKKLTPIEEELMKLGEQTGEIKMGDREVFMNWILDSGFELVGEEETDTCGLILARKVSKELVQIKREVEKEAKKEEEGVGEGEVDCTSADGSEQKQENEKSEETEKQENEKQEAKAQTSDEQAKDAEKSAEEVKGEEVKGEEVVELEEVIEMEDPLDPIPIEVKLFDYSWVEEIKKELDRKSSRRIWLIAKDSSFNGVIGFVKSLKREPEGERIRCLFNMDNCEDEAFIENKIKNGLVDKEPDSANETEKAEKIEQLKAEKAEQLKALISEEIIRKDLAINIIKNGEHGSYRQLAFSQPLCEETEYAVLDILTKGDLNSFKWVKSAMKENYDYPKLLYPKLDLGIHKPYLMDIYYSSINFKDVMVASGRVPLNAYPLGNCTAVNMIGMEASGILEDGRRVMCILPGSGIATKFVFIDNFTIFDVPDEWSLKEAATVPVAYMTSYYSLIERGKLMKGEKILIHAGSGGVGFAAISIALSYGCEVFTTVSSEEKRNFLKKHFPELKDRNFANSRDANFEEHILKETDGYGVDAVLNCLVQEKMRASIRCLAPGGRLLEIGKYDIMENSLIDTTSLGENKTMHVICLAHLYAETVRNPVDENPNVVIWKRICGMMKDGIKNGQVRPLNYTIFSKDECEKAFHYMANGKHMGKVLIEVKSEEETESALVKVVPKTRCNPLKSYIVTGGLGGFGLELSLWLASVGARKLVLTSRQGIKSTYQEMQVRKIREKGVDVQIVNEKCDSLESTERMLDSALQLGPIGGIFHLAMVLHDSIFINQTKEAFEEACEPKINTMFFLDYLTRKHAKYADDLDFFICFSSVAAALGNPGQCNYAYANSSIELIMEKRCAELNTLNLAVQFGAVGDVGVFAQKFGNMAVGGMAPQRILSCLKSLDELMNFRGVPILSCVTPTDESKLNGLGNGMDIVKTVMHLLGVQDASTLDPNVTLTELGMDSLMAVEIKQALEREYDIQMSSQEIRSLTYKRLQELSAELEERKKNQEKDGYETEQDSLAKLEEIFGLKEELFIEISSTTSIESSQPLFFVPSLETDFVLMKKITKYITRPIVGINWLADFDEKSTIREVASLVAKKLIEKYGTREFDLVGYGFGGCLVLEVAKELQTNTGGIVRKLIMLDGSPQFTKAKILDTVNQLELSAENEEKVLGTLLTRFTEYLIKVENMEILEEQLNKIPELNAKAEKVIALIKNKLNYVLEADRLLKMVRSMYNKMRMICSLEIADKFKGDILLIRAVDDDRSSLEKVSESYGIERLCTGKTEVLKMTGDHSSFLINNAKDIGHLIDVSTAYLSI